MKFVVWISSLFALAVLLGLASTVNTGYAILFVPPYRLELSFNLLVISIIVFVIVAHFIWKLTKLLVWWPKNMRRFQLQRKLKTTRHALREAGIAFFEGRFQRAEREAQKAIEDEYAPESCALALLIAARSASAMRDFHKRDRYLAKLDVLPPRLQLARHMLDAELRFEAKDLRGTLAAIERARALSPNLTSALRLELRVRLVQKHPEAILSLTEKLLKAKVLEPEQGHRYRLAAYTQQLAGMANSYEIRHWMRRVTAAERRHPQLVRAAVKQLIATEDYDYAASVLAEALDDEKEPTSDLSSELSELAERVSQEKRFELLTSAENWLKLRPLDHQLLLALGRLAYAQQLWGKAQSYLEASLSLQPTLRAHAELVRLFEATFQEEQAAHHYRLILAIALQQGI